MSDDIPIKKLRKNQNPPPSISNVQDFYSEIINKVPTWTNLNWKLEGLNRKQMSALSDLMNKETDSVKLEVFNRISYYKLLDCRLKNRLRKKQSSPKPKLSLEPNLNRTPTKTKPKTTPKKTPKKRK